MTRQILFVQGGGSEGTHDEWDNLLVADLEKTLGSGYSVRYPQMPDEANPDFARWTKALNRELADLPDGSIVIGHSIGATILINILALAPPKAKLGAIILLAAPFVGEGGWPAEGFTPRKHLGADLASGVPVLIYHGTDDDTAPIAHADLYAKAIPQAAIHRLKGRDHQLGNDLSEIAKGILAL